MKLAPFPRREGGWGLGLTVLDSIEKRYNTIWPNDCHIANLVIINWLVGAGLSISRWASEIAGLPAPTKCDIRKTNWYKLVGVEPG